MSSSTFRDVCAHSLTPGGYVRLGGELLYLTPRLQSIYAEGGVPQPDEVYLIGWRGEPSSLQLDRAELQAYEREPRTVLEELWARAGSPPQKNRTT